MKENEDIINDPSSSDADIYMAMLKESFDIAFIVGSLRNSDDIRKWWIREKPKRDRYGLTPEQEQQVVDMCRVAVSLLPEPEEPKTERPRPFQKRDRVRGRR